MTSAYREAEPTPAIGGVLKEELEVDQIQSEVLCGNGPAGPNGGLKHGAYLFLKFDTSAGGPAKGRALLGEIPVTSVGKWSPGGLSINIGLTYSGMKMLAKPFDKASIEDLLDSVGAPFEELKQTLFGRAELLGDTHDSAPKDWDMRDKAEELHAVVMLFGPTHKDVQDEVEKWRGRAETVAGATCKVHWGNELADSREHFGYVDGLSQPAIAGRDGEWLAGYGALDAKGVWRGIKAGEFVLGYDDEEGPFGGSPLLKNGTFFVLRKLEQDVQAFNRYLSKAAEREDVVVAAEKRRMRPVEWVGAQLMGRDFEGEPLLAGQIVPPPEGEEAESVTARSRNDFRYAPDQNGLQCPFGAHIRRMNPRDVSGRIADRSERHRLIRRTVMYAEEGKEYCLEEESFGHGARAGTGKDYAASRVRGMLFGCFNASIGRQFEVIQSGWLNRGDSAPSRLFTLRDPIAGANAGRGDFIVPGRPPIVLPDLDRFTTVRGGAYLFLPGLDALSLFRDVSRPPHEAKDLAELVKDPEAHLAPVELYLRRYLAAKAIDLHSVATHHWLPRFPAGKQSSGELEKRVLVVLAPLENPADAEKDLAKVAALDGILNRVRSRKGERLIHTARFLIIHELKKLERKGRGPLSRVVESIELLSRAREERFLFFACWFDGEREDFMESLASHSAELPFIHCHGWPAGRGENAEPAALDAFFKKRQLPVMFAYQAYPDSTENIRNALEVRERFIDLIAQFAGGKAKTTISKLFEIARKLDDRPPGMDAPPSMLDTKRAR